MANVFIILRDEKKAPDVNKKRQIPMSLQILKELGKSSECDKNLMVSMIKDDRIRVIFENNCFKPTSDCAKFQFHKNIFMENHTQNGDMRTKSLSLGYKIYFLFHYFSHSCVFYF